MREGQGGREGVGTRRLESTVHACACTYMHTVQVVEPAAVAVDTHA